MKRRDDATSVGGTDTTARPWWQARHGDASQLPTGTLRVRAPQSATSGRARGLRASRPLTRWKMPCGTCSADAAAGGSRVVAEVVERASGPNAERPTRTQLRTTRQVGMRVEAQRDRLTRCGSGSGDHAPLVAHHGQRVEAR
jgi:hypothetical protein